MGYDWNYIKNMTLAKMDMSDEEAEVQNLLARFTLYANEAMTQICSIKPKYTYYEFDVKDVNKLYDMPDDKFISFGDDVNYVEEYGLEGYFAEGPKYVKLKSREASDEDFMYYGYNQLKFFKPGVYHISYYARWCTFDGALLDDNTMLDAPNDVLDCLPNYIASQCFKVDDEAKSALFRNEFEMSLARLDNTNYKNTKTFKIGGGW